MGRRVLKFDGAFGPEGCGGGSAADYKKAGPPPPVISTEAKRSGEISPSDGTGGITDRRSLDSEYHGSGSCLSPIAAHTSARDDGGSGRPYRHVKKKGRGSAAGCVERLCSLRSRGDSAYGAEGGGLPYGQCL